MRTPSPTNITTASFLNFKFRASNFALRIFLNFAFSLISHFEFHISSIYFAG